MLFRSKQRAIPWSSMDARFISRRGSCGLVVFKQLFSSFALWRGLLREFTFYIRETLDVISLPPKNRTSETPLRRLAPSVCRKSRLSLSHRPGVAHLQR